MSIWKTRTQLFGEWKERDRPSGYEAAVGNDHVDLAREAAEEYCKESTVRIYSVDVDVEAPSGKLTHWTVSIERPPQFHVRRRKV